MCCNKGKHHNCLCFHPHFPFIICAVSHSNDTSVSMKNIETKFNIILSRMCKKFHSTKQSGCLGYLVGKRYKIYSFLKKFCL